MPNAFESSDQFDRPDPSNKVDHGRTKATVQYATPKAAKFQKGPLETTGIAGSFKDRSAVNPAKSEKFSAKRPEGL